MKQLFFILALVLVSCKKENPQPEPLKPAPITEASTTFRLTSSHPNGGIMNLDYKGDSNPDTSIVFSPSKTFTMKITKQTIYLTAWVNGRQKGDTARVFVDIDSGHKKVSKSDSLLFDMNPSLW